MERKFYSASKSSCLFGAVTATFQEWLQCAIALRKSELLYSRIPERSAASPGYTAVHIFKPPPLPHLREPARVHLRLAPRRLLTGAGGDRRWDASGPCAGTPGVRDAGGEFSRVICCNPHITRRPAGQDRFSRAGTDRAQHDAAGCMLRHDGAAVALLISTGSRAAGARASVLGPLTTTTATTATQSSPTEMKKGAALGGDSNCCHANCAAWNSTGSSKLPRVEL